MNILLVEDDPGLARGLQVNLELEGYKVSAAPTLSSADKIFPSKVFDLIILDLNLPDGSGFDFLTQVRSSGCKTPVIILTAQTHEDAVVEGLQRGANDYMRKPFGNKELFARIKAVLKQPILKEEQIRYADVVLLVEQRLIRHKDRNIEINRREFDILKYLVQRADKVVTRESLIQDMDKDSEIYDRTIDSHISHLRSKLKQNQIISIKISSVYGIGYRLEKANENQS